MSRFPPSRRLRASSGWRDVRMMIWSGLLAGLLLFQAMRPGPPLPLAPPPVAEIATRRSEPLAEAEWRVVDGDTFVHDGARIRIADIDTPEIFSPKCAAEKALGLRAKARLHELLAAGPYQLETLGRDEDRYGRKLRVVTRGGRSLGDQLVSEGLARTWSGRREPWC